jgi:uncharacterized membrane protein
VSALAKLTQLSPLSPKALSRALRTGTSDALKKRRGVLALSLTAAGSMGLIALYQMGVIKHLPDLPGRYFDADKVDASEEAYAYFSAPDGALGLASYAATAVLAVAGGPDRAKTTPWLPVLAAAKTGIDAAAAAKLSVDQWTEHRAFCVWCLLAAGATFAAVPLALPEARDALHNLHGDALHNLHGKD